MNRSELQSRWPALAKVPIECGDGWGGLIDKTMRRMVSSGFDQCRDTVLQIKEKFGTLSINLLLDDGQAGDVERAKQIEDIVDAAEEESAHLCEVCGQRGQMVVASGRWRMVRCFQHTPPSSVVNC